jgi:hypothetical protein
LFVKCPQRGLQPAGRDAVTPESVGALERDVGASAPFLHAGEEVDVAVGIGESFPGADGFQARRLQRRRLPLRDSKIRHADETDRTGAPRLPPGPLDQVIDILAFLVGQQLGHALRSAGTT